jgi:proteic killer suppression protein
LRKAVEISFRSTKLQKLCCTKKECKRKWGPENGALIGRRLADLNAAEDLEDLLKLPQTGFHALKGNRERQFAINLKYPFRLILEPANDPVPRKEDGGIDLSRVTKIRIIEVVDYHGD